MVKLFRIFFINWYYVVTWMEFIQEDFAWRLRRSLLWGIPLDHLSLKAALHLSARRAPDRPAYFIQGVPCDALMFSIVYPDFCPPAADCPGFGVRSGRLHDAWARRPGGGRDHPERTRRPPGPGGSGALTRGSRGCSARPSPPAAVAPAAPAEAPVAAPPAAPAKTKKAAKGKKGAKVPKWQQAAPPGKIAPPGKYNAGEDPEFAKQHGWPVKTPPILPGSILPGKRIVAYYGNPRSTKMGVLGEYPKDEMLRRLKVEVAKWEKADPSLPVLPALHLVAVVAQGEPGKSGKYRMIHPDALVNEVYGWAKEINGILFLDIQTGHSDIRTILPRFEWILKNPDVHLGMDPEFNLIKSGHIPSKKIGTYDAADVNYAAGYLAELVKKYNLPPKVLIVHRFTRQHGHQCRKGHAPPRGAGRHGHGRLGRPLAEAGFLPGLHRRPPGGVYRLQALLSQRHQERRPADDAPGRAEAEPEAALHPVPVIPGRTPAPKSKRERLPCQGSLSLLAPTRKVRGIRPRTPCRR